MIAFRARLRGKTNQKRKSVSILCVCLLSFQDLRRQIPLKMCLNSTSTKPVRQVSACLHLQECVYGLVKLSQQSSRPQPLAEVHRLHSVQAILVLAGKHGMIGYRQVLLEYLDRMNAILQVVFFNFLLSMEE